MKDKYYPLSFSSLKAFAESPSHFIAYKERQVEPTTAMLFGTAVHEAVLEPEKFKLNYAIARARKGTKIYLSQLEEGKKLLNKSDYYSCKKIAENIKAHPMANELLNQCTEFEKEIKGTIHGLPFRGFADAISPDFVLDLKTTRDGSPYEFTNSVYRMKYHIQAAIYTTLTNKTDYWIVAVENKAPYVVTAYLIDKKYLIGAQMDLLNLIEEFKEWNGKPGGYDRYADNGYLTLKPPTWIK